MLTLFFQYFSWSQWFREKERDYPQRRWWCITNDEFHSAYNCSSVCSDSTISSAYCILFFTDFNFLFSIFRLILSEGKYHRFLFQWHALARQRDIQQDMTEHLVLFHSSTNVEGCTPNHVMTTRTARVPLSGSFWLLPREKPKWVYQSLRGRC